MDNMRQLLSIKEVADMLGVSQKTIRRHIQSGKLISSKLGGVHRIQKSEFQKFLKLDASSSDVVTDGSFPFESKLPEGPIEKKWENHKGNINLVSPANKRDIDVIVVGTGLAGSSAAATLAELGYNVKAFCFQDSSRRAHSIAAQGGINAAKNYQGDGDSVYRPNRRLPDNFLLH